MWYQLSVFSKAYALSRSNFSFNEIDKITDEIVFLCGGFQTIRALGLSSLIIT